MGMTYRFQCDECELAKENKVLRKELEYYKSLAQSLANNNIRLNGWKNE